DGIRDGGMLFFHQSVSIAPVFYSLGNHEKYIRNEDRLRCRGYGVHILDNQDECIDVQGNKVRIGGLSYRADWNWCEQFSQKDGIRILMAHHPEYVADHMLKDDQILPLDLILSGHAHGGQLAFLDHSLYSPGQGFLPKYTKGMRMTSHGMWIISAGTANTIKVPRFNNPTELVLIEMGGKS
ncbi:metallophosphoesterase, partial [uncultured Dubosiella sp.]